MTGYEQSRERFERDTAEHQMRVLLDGNDASALYRHLRCQQPDTYTYGFDLITWPGYLAIVGDAGDYVFQRIADMFEFFESDRGGINPHYWSEKLQADNGRVRVYSYDAFKAHVEEWFAYTSEDMDAEEKRSLRAAVEEQLFGGEGVEHSEDAARMAIRDFEHDNCHVGDGWEWDLRAWHPMFLWCCHAIVWGIEQYRKSQRQSQDRSEA